MRVLLCKNVKSGIGILGCFSMFVDSEVFLDTKRPLFFMQGCMSEVAKELIPSITRLLIDEDKPHF